MRDLKKINKKNRKIKRGRNKNFQINNFEFRTIHCQRDVKTRRQKRLWFDHFWYIGRRGFLKTQKRREYSNHSLSTIHFIWYYFLALFAFDKNFIFRYVNVIYVVKYLSNELFPINENWKIVFHDSFFHQYLSNLNVKYKTHHDKIIIKNWTRYWTR